MHRRVVTAGVMLMLALAGCQSTKETASATSASSAPVGGLFDRVGGAAIEGSVVFQRRDGGVAMAVQLNGGAPGVYRVAIHANGNCSSPNGFSAGAPWSPPGSAPQVYTMATNSEGTATLTTRIAGLALDGPNGVLGKSVVVHEGAMGTLEAQPGVPNRRIACAVIGAAPSLIQMLR